MNTGLDDSEIGAQQSDVLHHVGAAAAPGDVIDIDLLGIKEHLDGVIATKTDVDLHVVLEDDVDKGVHHLVVLVASIKIIEVDGVIRVQPGIPGRHGAGIDVRSCGSEQQAVAGCAAPEIRLDLVAGSRLYAQLGRISICEIIESNGIDSWSGPASLAQGAQQQPVLNKALLSQSGGDPVLNSRPLGCDHIDGYRTGDELINDHRLIRISIANRLADGNLDRPAAGRRAGARGARARDTALRSEGVGDHRLGEDSMGAADRPIRGACGQGEIDGILGNLEVDEFSRVGAQGADAHRVEHLEVIAGDHVQADSHPTALVAPREALEITYGLRAVLAADLLEVEGHARGGVDSHRAAPEVHSASPDILYPLVNIVSDIGDDVVPGVSRSVLRTEGEGDALHVDLLRDRFDDEDAVKKGGLFHVLRIIADVNDIPVVVCKLEESRVGVDPYVFLRSASPAISSGDNIAEIDYIRPNRLA